MQPKVTPAHVAISSTATDYELRMELARHLQPLVRAGWLWIDDGLGGQVGEPIERADIVLLLVTADYFADETCFQVERPLALQRHEKRQATVLPIHVRPVHYEAKQLASIPVFPESGVAIVAAPDRDQAWRGVCRRVREILVQRGHLPIHNPYRGLEVFEEKHKDLFFGRTASSEALERELLGSRMRSHCRFLCVIGFSGSGKSSLVRAGLIPRLRLRFPHIALFRPEREPSRCLAAALARTLTDDPSPVAKTAELGAVLRAATPGANPILDIYRACLGPADTPLLLVIDQLEQVFSSEVSPTERDQFLGSIASAVGESCAPVVALAVLRSDFLPEAQRHKVLGKLLAGALCSLAAPDEADIREMIREPALQAGYPWDATLVERVCSQVSKYPGVLSLLQVALQRLWEDRLSGQEPAVVLTELGDVGGVIGREADKRLEALAEPRQRRIAQRLFVKLADVGRDPAAPLARRKVAIADLAARGESLAEVRSVLEHFAEPFARLVILSTRFQVAPPPPQGQGPGASGAGAEPPPPQEEVVEIVHEALFEQWATLRRWIAQYRPHMPMLQRLAEAASEWSVHGRPDGLLWQPPLLTQLETATAQPVGEPAATAQLIGDELPELQQDFFAASRAQQQRLREKERERAATEQRARRLGRWAIGLSGLGGVFLLLLLVALVQWRNASRMTWLLDLERGRQTLLGHRPQEALPYLAHAYASQPEDRAIRLLVARAVAPVDAMGEPMVGHAGRIPVIAYSPDGRWLATGGLDQTVRLWDPAHSKQPRPPLWHDGSLRWLAFVGDGQELFSVTEEGHMYLWNTASGQLRVPAWRVPGVLQEAVTMSLDQEQIVALYSDGIVRIWSRRDGQLHHEQPLQVAGHSALAAIGVRNGGKEFVVPLADGVMATYPLDHVGAPELWQQPLTVADGAEFSPDGRYMAAYQRSIGQIQVVDLDDRAAVPYCDLQIGSIVTSISFARQGLLFAVTGGRPQVILKRCDKTDDAARFQVALQAHESVVRRVVFSPQGETLATASWDGCAIIWSQAGEPLVRLSSGPLKLEALAFSPDGFQLAATDDSGRVWPWKAQSSGILQALPRSAGSVDALLFAAGGHLLVVAGDGGEVMSWDTQSETLRSRWKAHQGRARLAIPPGSAAQMVSAGAKDGVVALWNLWNGQALWLNTSTGTEIAAVATDPKLSQVAVALKTRGVQILRGSDGYVERTLPMEGTAWVLRYRADGQVLLAATDRGQVRVFDTHTYQPILERRLDGVDWQTGSCSSQDDSVLLVGSKGIETQRQRGNSRTGHIVRMRIALNSRARKDCECVWTSEDLSILPPGASGLYAGADKEWFVAADKNHVVTHDFCPAQPGTTFATLEPTLLQMGVRYSVERDGEPATMVQLSPDGSTVLTGSTDGVARLWDRHNMTLLARLAGHREPLSAVAWDASARRAATADTSGMVLLWDVHPETRSPEDLARLVQCRTSWRLKDDRVVGASQFELPGCTPATSAPSAQ